MRSLNLFSLLLIFLVAGAQAQSDVYRDFGDYRVHYSVFNSSFVDPDTARLHNITRGEDIALVNIAVTDRRTGAAGQGLSAEVSGRVQNLLMQSRPLEFAEIQEGQAYYYLASFRISDQDPQHFFISVTPQGGRTQLDVEFTRTLHAGP